MKNSIGTDLAEVARIRKAMENPRFLVEFFTEAERSYILARPYTGAVCCRCLGCQRGLFQGSGNRGPGLVAPGGGSPA